MSSKIPKTDLVIIAILGLLIQSIWLVRIEQPTYMDAYYYSVNGERLASGHGFSEMVIWQYFDDPAGLPTPSHTYWMPLPSMIAALGWSQDAQPEDAKNQAAQVATPAAEQDALSAEARVETTRLWGILDTIEAHPYDPGE